MKEREFSTKEIVQFADEFEVFVQNMNTIYPRPKPANVALKSIIRPAAGSEIVAPITERLGKVTKFLQVVEPRTPKTFGRGELKIK